jgi:3-phosphoshikimate 1-carboxyvinyltransferase
LRVRIKGPQSLQGRVKAPGSKAYTHRALLASLLSRGESIIQDPSHCDDALRTLEGIRSLGARAHVENNCIIASGINRPIPNQSLDCRESGATLRFLAAISSTSLETVRLTGSPRLASRPLDPLVKALRGLGAKIEMISTDRGIEVLTRGPLKGGHVSIRGDISSQFISGLLFAAPLALRDVTISVDGALESRPYVDLTLHVLTKHGISIEESDREFRVAASQAFKPASHNVPGDLSSAAFLVASTGAAGREITISGLGTHGLEPDSAILKIIPEIGLEMEQDEDGLTIGKRTMNGFEFDASNNPDLVPPLETLACFAKGSSQIRGLKRLIYKESDRLHSLPAELAKMGARIHVDGDMVRIEGGGELVGGTLDSHADHRVAMASAAAALGAKGESIIQDSQVVSKSYPEFFQDLAKLGAQLSVE